MVLFNGPISDGITEIDEMAKATLKEVVKPETETSRKNAVVFKMKKTIRESKKPNAKVLWSDWLIDANFHIPLITDHFTDLPSDGKFESLEIVGENPHNIAPDNETYGAWVYSDPYVQMVQSAFTDFIIGRKRVMESKSEKQALDGACLVNSMSDALTVYEESLERSARGGVRGQLLTTFKAFLEAIEKAHKLESGYLDPIYKCAYDPRAYGPRLTDAERTNFNNLIGRFRTQVNQDGEAICKPEFLPTLDNVVASVESSDKPKEMEVIAF